MAGITKAKRLEKAQEELEYFAALLDYVEKKLCFIKELSPQMAETVPVIADYQRFSVLRGQYYQQVERYQKIVDELQKSQANAVAKWLEKPKKSG